MTIQKSKLPKILLPAIMLFLIGVSYAGSQEIGESKPWEGRWIVSQFKFFNGVEISTVKGILHVYPDGKSSSQMMFSDRLDLGISPTSLSEFRNLFSTYWAGFGTYSVDKNAGTITFSDDGNLRPHLMKTTITFKYEISTKGLTLIAPEGYKVFYTR